MRLLICLYTALLIGANAAAADITTIEALRSGSMKKLTFHTAAKAVPEVYFATSDGDQKQLSDFRGKIVLLISGQPGAHPAALKCRCYPNYKPISAEMISKCSPLPPDATPPVH